MGLSLSVKKDNIGENTATISYEVSLDNEHVSDFTIQEFKIGNKNITSNKESGKIEVSGLDPGDKNTVNGRVVCAYMQDTYVGVDENNNPIYEEKEYTITYRDSISFYTHPGPFEIGAEKNKLIKDVLNEDNIDNWITHFQKVYHWFKQSNKDYEKTDSLKIPEDKIISAKWFNACMDAMRAVEHDEEDAKYVKGAINDPPGDLITAEAINRMNFSGIK